jgi:hypothetical protein
MGMFDTSTSDRRIAEEVLGDDYARYEALVLVRKNLEDQKKIVEGQIVHVNDDILEFMAEHGEASLVTTYGSIFIVGDSVTKSLDKKKLVEMVTKHGIPVSELEQCVKETKRRGGLRFKWSKDEMEEED